MSLTQSSHLTLTGVMILAWLNIAVCMVMLGFPWFVSMPLHDGGFQGWIFILLAANVVLYIGARTSNKVIKPMPRRGKQRLHSKQISYIF